MFVEKTLEEFNAMTLKEQADYILAKKESEALARKEELENAIAEANKNKATKDELEELTSKQALVVKELELLGARIMKMSEPNNLNGSTASFFDVVKGALSSKEEELKALADGDSNSVTVKAVVNMTDATTIDAVGSENHINLTTNTGIVSKIRSRILQYLSNVTVSGMTGNRVNWIEELDEQGTPIFIAEAATKTKVSVRYEEREMKSKKIGIHGKVSTEMLRNLPNLVRYIQNNLVKRTDIATEDGLFFADGTGNTLKGITEYATAFTGGSLAGTLATPTASDVFRAVALQVQEAYGIASGLFVAPGVLATLDVEKDSNGAYLLPPFRTSDGAMVAGMKLIPTSALTGSAFDFVGGDLSVVDVRFADSMTIQIDKDGNDFTTNMRTILVEQELVQFVSANDTQVLVSGTIADAITALTVAP